MDLRMFSPLHALAPLRVAVIGGGFSGTAAAYHLLSEAVGGARTLECHLFDLGANVGGGIAYGTQSLAHLLNVRASGMSLTNDDPAAFSRWLAANHPEYGAHSFAPRALYRRYLENALKSKQAQAKERAEVHLHREEIVSLRPMGTRYELRSRRGVSFEADSVILALGNLPFCPNLGERCAALLQSPWSIDAIRSASSAANVGIIGTGLTAIDVVLALEAENCKADYTMISRHGHLPSPHLPQPQDLAAAAKACAAAIVQCGDVRSAFKLFRAALEEGIPWRDLVDSLRPGTQALWAAWPTQEKTRFLRHLRSLWDTHRHRVPAETNQVLADLRAAGRLRIVAATVSEISDRNGRVLIKLRNRGEAAQSELDVDTVFNSIGLISDVRRSESALIGDLARSGIAAFDELGMGLKTSQSGNVVDAEGRECPSLYALGPLRRGDLWETTAVREIRTQSENLATRILRA